MAIEVKKFLDAGGVGKIHELVNTAMENYATDAGVVYHINGITVTVTDIGNGHLSVATSGMDSLLTDGVYTINGWNFICRVNQVTARTWIQEIYLPFNPLYLDGNKMPKTVGWYRQGNKMSVDVRWDTWHEMYYANDITYHTHAISDVTGLVGELGNKEDRLSQISRLNLNSNNKIVLSNTPNGRTFTTRGVAGLNWSTLFISDDGSYVWPSYHGSGSAQPYIIPADEIVYTVFVDNISGVKRYLVSLDAVFGGE